MMTEIELMQQLLKWKEAAAAQIEYDRMMEEYQNTLAQYEHETAHFKQKEQEYEQALTEYQVKVDAANAEYKAMMTKYHERCATLRMMIGLYGNRAADIPPEPKPPVLPPPPVKPSFPEKPQPPVKQTFVKPKLPALIEPKDIISHYNLNEINHSAFKYCQTVRAVADQMIDVIDDITEYLAANPETFKLLQTFPPSPSRACNFTPDIDWTRHQLEGLRYNADASADQIDQASMLEKIAELEAAPRASFAIVVEMCARLVNGVLRHIDFIERNRDALTRIFERYSQTLRLKYRWLTETNATPLFHFIAEGNLLSKTGAETPAERLLAFFQEYDNYHRSTKEMLEKMQPLILSCNRREQLFLLRWIGGRIQ